MPSKEKLSTKEAGVDHKRRTEAERRETRRILFGSKGGRPPKYRPEFHPADIVGYFEAALEQVKEVERVESPQGGVKYVQAPVPPPTLAAYASSIGVSRETLWYWGKEHEAFSSALDRCKAMQEQLFVHMAALGAYVPSVAIFMLKNLNGWRDRIEQRYAGGVTLVFDEQDSRA